MPEFWIQLPVPGPCPGRLGPLWAPRAPSDHLAIGRCDCQNSHGRGQSSVLFSMKIWVAIWDVSLTVLGLLWCYNPITDLEIWTFGIDFIDLAIYCR